MFNLFGGGGEGMTALSFMIRLTIAVVVIVAAAIILPKVFPPTEKDVERAKRKKAYNEAKKAKKEQKKKERQMKRAEKNRKNKML
ncbi:MAG: hypothetical protein IJC70_01805 [Firmicutes bacterium]|nr:hypothetical protein [Bacillota bacterium]